MLCDISKRRFSMQCRYVSTMFTEIYTVDVPGFGLATFAAGATLAPPSLITLIPQQRILTLFTIYRHHVCSLDIYHAASSTTTLV